MTLELPRRGGLALAWARTFVRALADSGVRHAVLSPGSRSTLLALAFAECTEIHTDVVVDERSAAFFALGVARWSGAPVALVCTSGSAPAHYLPAIVEASRSDVPLIAITADRPWSLSESGALQTVDQVKLFGAHVRAFFDVGTPEPTAHALRAVARLGAQAVSRSLGARPGPVHVNARFDKPLEPIPSTGSPEGWELALEAVARRDTPRVSHAMQAVDAALVEELTRTMLGRRGLIVAGPAPSHGDTESYREALFAMARVLRFPILAEGTSQVRFGVRPPDLCFLDDIEASLSLFARTRGPELIVQFGDIPTATSLNRWLQDTSIARIVVSRGSWADPHGTASWHVFGELPTIARAIAERARTLTERGPRDERAWAEPVAIVSDSSGFRETSVAEALLSALATRGTRGAPSALVVSNSRCIRAIDKAPPPTTGVLRVVHQRGASGIDGLVAGAAGVRRASAGHVALFLGDVAMLHDVGSLAVVRAMPGPLPIVVVQNGGGQIFAELPIAHSIPQAAFEQLFLTPPRMDLERAASAFELGYARVTSRAALDEALERAFERREPFMLEAVVSGERAP